MKVFFYIPIEVDEHPGDYSEYYICFYFKTLNMHRLINFDIDLDAFMKFLIKFNENQFKVSSRLATSCTLC